MLQAQCADLEEQLNCISGEHKDRICKLEDLQNCLAKLQASPSPTTQTPPAPSPIRNFANIEEAIEYLRSEVDKEIAAREALAAEFQQVKQKWANPHFCY